MGQSKQDSAKGAFTDSLLKPSIGISTLDSASLSKLRIYGTISSYAHVLYTTKYYTINWKKVKTFADLKLIMQLLYIQIGDNSKDFNKIKKYLILTK
jgi:hypothetical protein